MLKGKGPFILLVLVIFICLGVIGYTTSLLRDERSKTQSLEVQIENLQRIQRDLKIKLDTATKQVSDLEQQLRDSQDQITALTTDLDLEKRARQENLAEIDRIRFSLEEERTLKADLESKLSAAQLEAGKIQNQLKSVQSQRAALEARVKDLEAKMQRVELGTIIVGEEGGSLEGQWQPTPGALEGQVLVVNKEYNFVVINLGTKNGVNINNLFGVYSQGQYIGDVKVEKVHESMCAANFITPGLKEKISEGDRVVFKAR